MNFVAQRQTFWKEKWLIFSFFILLMFGLGCSEINSVIGDSLVGRWFFLSAGVNTGVTTNFEIIYADVSYFDSKNYTVVHWSHLEKSKIYHIRICLRDNVTHNRIIGHRFQVLNEEKTHGIHLNNEEYLTDGEGCISWRERILYNYFAPSKYLAFKRVVRSFSPGVYRGEIDFTYAVNLWSENRGEGSQNPFDDFNGTLTSYHLNQILEQRTRTRI